MAEKVLVTGADGFIGSHLVEALLKQGQEVRAFVYYHPYTEKGWLAEIPKEFRSGLELFPGDVRDQRRVDAAMNGVSSVFHLAALVGIPYSYFAPASYLQTNVLGTQHVLDAALGHQVNKVVITSTSEVYGTARYVPIDESHPKQAQSPYSASKIAADALAQSYYLSFGLPLIIVRPFNTYGPRQSTRAFIPTVIRQLLAGVDVLNLGDLTPTRDLVYVEDTVSGFLSAHGAADLVGEEVNIATGEEYRMADVLAVIEQLLEVQVPVHQDPERVRPKRSEVQRLCGSQKKLFSTGWTHQNSLQQGLLKTVEWFKSRYDGEGDPLAYRL